MGDVHEQRRPRSNATLMVENWDGGEVLDVDPAAAGEAADRIWAFVFPSVDAGFGDSI